ncbi:conserved hypothetical protein [Coccidioides posadasii str. Silveira]|uniref:Uncharacterized protein n=1 Tax=Coccidioides posadasii (strain RMSCC 757 / Silveira) TaxID=443226 RepID=E9CZN2_COCPS|nr:conserved hypothetical protein [Coccidioides posadasii str. Silveira]
MDEGNTSTSSSVTARSNPRYPAEWLDTATHRAKNQDVVQYLRSNDAALHA